MVNVSIKRCMNPAKRRKNQYLCTLQGRGDFLQEPGNYVTRKIKKKVGRMRKNNANFIKIVKKIRKSRRPTNFYFLAWKGSDCKLLTNIKIK
jgi:hypothetical protein